MGASAPNLLTPCEFVGHLKISDDVVKKPLELGMRKIQVPDLPGLGMEIHPAKLEQYRIATKLYDQKAR